MKGDKKKAGVAGSICLDINLLFKSESLIEEGKQIDLSDVKFTLGGCVGNTGLALAALGIPVKLFYKVGDDMVGKVVSSMIEDYAIETEAKTIFGSSSSSSTIITQPGKDRTILHKRGVSQSITEDDITEDFLSDIDLFHFGYPPKMKELWKEKGAHMAYLLKKVQAKKIATSVDMCMPNNGDDYSYMEAFLPYVDIFMPSYEEMLRLLMPEEYKRINETANGRNIIDFISEKTIVEIATWLIDCGVHIVLLKIGKKGLYLKTDNRASLIPSLALSEKWNNRELWIAPKYIEKTISTIGAGDTAIAGFLASLLEASLPEEALSVASCTAAKCIGSEDRGHRLPIFTEIEKTALGTYEQEELSIGLSNWKKEGLIFYGRFLQKSRNK